jgi:hypothetical protein
VTGILGIHRKLPMLLKSALIGCALGTLPAWPWLYQLGDSVQVGVSVLMLPGLIVGLIINGGRLHDAGLAFAITASSAIYTALIYVLFWVRQNWR